MVFSGGLVIEYKSGVGNSCVYTFATFPQRGHSTTRTANWRIHIQDKKASVHSLLMEKGAQLQTKPVLKYPQATLAIMNGVKSYDMRTISFASCKNKMERSDR